MDLFADQSNFITLLTAVSNLIDHIEKKLLCLTGSMTSKLRTIKGKALQSSHDQDSIFISGLAAL